MSKNSQINISEVRADFDTAPQSTLFDQKTIACVIGCSTAKLERDRWQGGGLPFIKIGRLVKYRKADVLKWLDQYQSQTSTSQTVREVA